MNDLQMETVYSNIASLVYEKIREKGISQKQIAKEIDIPPSLLSNFVNGGKGRKNPSVETIYKIARYFEVSVDWILAIPGAAKTSDPKSRAICENLGLSTLSFNLLSDDPKRTIHNALDFLCYQHKQYLSLYEKKITVLRSESNRKRNEQLLMLNNAQANESLAEQLSAFAQTLTDEKEHFAITKHSDGGVVITKNGKTYKTPASNTTESSPRVTALFGEISMGRSIDNIISVLTAMKANKGSNDLKIAMKRDLKEMIQEQIKEDSNDPTSET